MKPLISLNTSDWHLGQRRLNPEIMCENFRKFLSAHLPGIDLLNIQGDIFDTAIGYGDPASPFILKFLIWLLRTCDHLGITVRVLRGTIYHDRTQSLNLQVIHESLGLKNDFRYIDKVSIEYIEAYDLWAGYIPDNVPYESSDDVIKELKSQMSALGRTTLDYVHVHGYFAHVLPNAAHDVKIVYREDQFDFVTRYVDVGHVHQHSVHNNILYNGSMDRLGHGEEDPKGMVRIEDRVTDARITFIENPYAMIFKTFDYSTMDVDENITQAFKEALSQYSPAAPLFVRIIHPRLDIRQALGQILQQSHPLTRYTHGAGSKTKPEDVEDDIIVPVVVDDANTITEDNLTNLVHQYLASKEKLGDMTLDDIDTIIQLGKKG